MEGHLIQAQIEQLEQRTLFAASVNSVTSVTPCCCLSTFLPTTLATSLHAPASTHLARRAGTSPIDGYRMTLGHAGSWAVSGRHDPRGRSTTSIPQSSICPSRTPHFRTTTAATKHRWAQHSPSPTTADGPHPLLPRLHEHDFQPSSRSRYFTTLVLKRWRVDFRGSNGNSKGSETTVGWRGRRFDRRR